MSAKVSSLKQVPVLGAGNLLTGPSNTRRRITFFPSNTGHYCFFTQPVSGIAQGAAVGQNATPITLDLDVDGTVVQEAFFGASSQALTAVILEVFD